MTIQESARKRGVLRAVLLQIAIIIATLAVAEVVLRVIDLRYLRAHRVGADRIYNYDAELGWFPVPNSDVTFTGIRTIKVRHNSLGLRDIEHDAASKPTIAFIGDSFVWGYDAEQNERFTEVLRAKMPEHRIVNAGVTAYGTDQEYLVLRRLWDRIKPNVVVLMVCIDNDRKENAVNTRQRRPLQAVFRDVVRRRRVQGNTSAVVTASLLRRQLAGTKFLGRPRCGLGLCADRQSAGHGAGSRPNAWSA